MKKGWTKYSVSTIDVKRYLYPGTLDAARLKNHISGPNTHPLLVYRQVAHHYSLVLILILMPPYGVYNLLLQQYWMGGVELLVTLLSCISIYQLVHDKPVLITPEVFVIGGIAIIIYSSYALKAHNIFWAYPLVVFVFFMLPESLAKLLSALFLVCLIPCAYEAYSLGTANSFTFSVIVSGLMIGLFFGLLHQQENLLHDLAITDGLTGALNRRSFDEEMLVCIEMKNRYKQPFAMILIDLDFFKLVNDDYGHGAGDNVLKSVVKRIGKRLRSSDDIFRYGGEEFALILPQTTGVNAQKIAESLCEIIRNADLLPEKRVTASFGVASLQELENANSWLQRCDKALYQAKSEGRDRVCRSD
ncbi:MAG: diguanylate cyclase [Pseudomonadales bacterium]|nr:diguanylate cyclase [Pseudomonadales bacterium]